MSWEAVTWVLKMGEELNLEPTIRHVFLILGNRANEEGYLYPSLQWVAKRTGLSRRTVQRAMSVLVNRGLLVRAEKAKDDGARTSDDMKLAMDQTSFDFATPRDTMTPPLDTVSPPPVTLRRPPLDMVTPYIKEEVKDLKKHKARSAAASVQKVKFTPPPWIDQAAWDDYEAMRTKARKPMTDRARLLVIKELHRLKITGHDPLRVLEQSTRNTWADVYPLKTTNGNGAPCWWESDDAMLAKAAELGVSTRGLSTQALRAKINEKLNTTRAH